MRTVIKRQRRRSNRWPSRATGRCSTRVVLYRARRSLRAFETRDRRQRTGWRRFKNAGRYRYKASQPCKQIIRTKLLIIYVAGDRADRVPQPERRGIKIVLRGNRRAGKFPRGFFASPVCITGGAKTSRPSSLADTSRCAIAKLLSVSAKLRPDITRNGG